MFDCDGLLLDTEECWAVAEAALFAEHGRGIGPKERRLLLGAGPGKGGRVLATAFGLPGQEAVLFARLLELVEMRVAASTRPMPGAEGLVRGLSGTLPLGVASNSPRVVLEAALRSANLLRCFDVVVGSDEGEEEKPAPDPYLLACRRLGVEPARSVALEDSRRGSPPHAARGYPWSVSLRWKGWTSRASACAFLPRRVLSLVNESEPGALRSGALRMLPASPPHTVYVAGRGDLSTRWRRVARETNRPATERGVRT